MELFKYALIGIIALSSFCKICYIGEEREPLTPGMVAVDTLLNALFIWGIAYFF